MITLDLGRTEYYNENEKQFVYEEGGIVRFEYSLKTIYDWEARWRKPFLKGDLTDDELFDFYKLMALDPVKDEFLTDEVMEILSKYISDSHTATTFSSNRNGQNGNKKASAKVYTAEEIYALMAMNQIPLDFENRNLNRLLIVLRIISNYNSPPQKMTKADILKQNRELNAQRRAQMKTKG